MAALFTERVFCSSRSDVVKVLAKNFDKDQGKILGPDNLPGIRCKNAVPGRLQVLYQHIGTHADKLPAPFRKIFKDLCALHAAGLSHGDMRDANMVFWGKGRVPDRL